jgi:nucleoside-diphosphate-sugar epimerase
MKQVVDTGSQLTAAGDPRITPMGAWLRRTKLDELPQVFNVLLGHMSLVGPRPEVPKFVSHYTEKQRRVLDVRPGITGPSVIVHEEKLLAAQEDKENFYLTTVMPAKLEIDLDYCENISFKTDLHILYQTFVTLLTKIDELDKGSPHIVSRSSKLYLNINEPKHRRGLSVSQVNLQVNLWLERLARALVDFIAVQIAAILSLMFLALYSAFGTQAQSQPGESALFHYYVHTLLPLSVVFPIMHSFFGLYTKLRGYTIEYKLRLAASSAALGTLLIIFVSFLTTRSPLPRSIALVFGILAIGAATGVRWLKDWLFHRESEASQAAAVVESVPVPGQTILVVGGAGYIGSIVVSKLLARGYSVRLLDNLLYGDESIKPLLSDPKLEFMSGDCRNIQDVVRAMNAVNGVVHMAAIVGDPACAADDKNALQINYAATRMMLEIAKGNGIERFIFASSCSVYGASDDIVDEKSETIPVSLYAETKLHSELALLEARSTTCHPTILRFATVFGLAPRPRFDLVVNLLTAKAIQEGVVTIYNGDQWRPFVHVKDVAEAVVQTLLAPIEAVSGEIFNVGDDRLNFTLAEIAEKIRLQVPNTRVEYVNNADRRNYRVSFRKIRDCLGWTAEFSVEDGISEIKQAFDSGRIRSYRHPFYSNVSYLKERGLVEAKSELDVQVMAAFAGARGGTAITSSRGGSQLHGPLALSPETQNS